MSRAKRTVGAAPPPQRRTSLKEIAALTGFSVTTVSMVLNGRAEEFGISARTRDLVLASAREHNYQPNLHARSLRSRTTDILGLVVPTLYNPFFSEMAETFERLARADQKLPLIAVTHYDRQEELDTIGYFLAQKVASLFTANPMALQEVSGLCSRSGTSQIILDSEESQGITVTTDNFHAARALSRLWLASMAAAGLPGRPFFVGGMADHRITQQRLAGFAAALRERGLPFSDDQFVESRFEAGAAHRQLQAFFRSRKDIGGIFLNSLPALDGLARFFPEAPDRCRRLHYAVFDYNPLMSLLVDLRLVAIRQDPDAMMQTAYRIFADGIDAERPRTHYVPYDVVVMPALKPFL
jgi:DNA-binding LacI/PurR family transcriptional regulator